VSKHVLFDLDGTLLDTAQDFTRVLNNLLQENGRAPVSYEQVRETVSDGARALVRMGFDIDEDDPAFQTHLQSLLDAYAEQIDRTESAVFQGIENLLRSIDSNNFHWGIVTNKPSRFTTPLLQKIPLLQNCASVICADQLAKSKPDPEGLIRACQLLNITPDDCIYVGDHLRDIEAGKNASMATIAVAWGYFPANTELSTWQADFIAQSPEEISHYLFGKI
jgi:2-phosphoglycolate phosphatase